MPVAANRLSVRNNFSEMYRFFDQAPMLVGVFRGPRGVCEYANPMLRKLFGGRDVEGKTMRQLMKGVHSTTYPGNVERVFRDKRPLVINRAPLTADWNGRGQLHDEYFNLALTPITAEDGSVEGVFFAGTSVTPEVKLRQQAQENEANFRQLMEEAPDAVILYNTDNSFADVNPATTHLTGYSKAEMLRMKVTDFLRPTEQSRLEAVKEERRRGEDRLVEWQVRNREGRLIDIEAKTNFLADKQQYISFIRDITERKRLEREVSEAALKEEVLQAKTKLLEEQRQQLLKLNQAKDEFITIAAHQLRTPATAVKQYLGIMLEGYAGDITDQQRKMLQTAFESNERQINVVKDLLIIAELESGQSPVDMAVEDLVVCIRELAKDLQDKLAAKGQAIELRLPKSSKLRCNKRYLRVALEHLLTNASYYSPAGKPITVNLAKRGRQVVVSVADQGIGIRKRDHKLLFQKFSRLPGPQSTIDSNGLGLYLTRQIAQAHGGDVQVESSFGKGSVFTLRLPLTPQ